MSDGIPVRDGGGNVFSDLKLPDADQLLVKAELARRIAAIIRARRLSQAEVARLLGVDQPKVSALLRGRLSGFSTERLIRFLNSLGRDVEIVVRRKRPGRARGRVKVVAA